MVKHKTAPRGSTTKFGNRQETSLAKTHSSAPKLTAEQTHIIRSNPPLVMSAVEAAVYTDFCERNFRKLAAQGVFPHIRVGRRLLFRREALDAALVRLESKNQMKTFPTAQRLPRRGSLLCGHQQQSNKSTK